MRYDQIIQSKKATRGFLAALLVAALAVVAPIVPTEQAHAATNNVPEPFNFTMDGKGSTSGTRWRIKGNTSPIYVYVESAKGNPRAYVDAARSASGAEKIEVTLGSPRFSKKGSMYISSLAKESGRNYVRLTSWAPNGNAKVTGKWSPDSSN